MQLHLPSSRRLCVALGLFAALTATMRAEPAPALSVARQQRVELRTLARPSALLGGVAHIGAGASSPAADGPRVTHIDADAPVSELDAPAELDARHVLPLLKDGISGPLQRVAGHDAVLTLVGDDLYVQRRLLPPDERVLSVRALWAQVGEAACGLTPAQVQYDAARRQWTLAAVANPGRADAALLLATSETSDPTDGWELQRLHVADGHSFGTLPPMVTRAGHGLLVRAGLLAAGSEGTCAAEGAAALGEPAEWHLAAKDSRARDNNPLASPTVSLVSPGGGYGTGSGSGSSTTLSFNIADPVSASDLRQGWILLNSSLDGRNACWITYDVAARSLSLVNDAASGIAGSVTPGQGGTAENSQCSINGLGSSTTTGFGIQISVSVSFKPAFRGTRLIYLYADDKGGLSSTWQLRGYWQVPPASAPPFAPSISPINSTGTSQVFEVSFTDPDGSADIRQTWLLFNPTLDARNACWVFYDAVARQFGLVNDAGTGEAGRVGAGQDARVENSQCTLYGSNSSTSLFDTRPSTRFSIAFRPAFAGLKNAYVFADDRAGQTIGWREMGQWIVPVDNPIPRVVNVTSNRSNSGRDTSVTFFLRVSDPAGNQNVRQAGLLINGVLSGVNACWISYDGTTGRISLVNNAGNGEAGQVRPGVVGVAENDQCAISGIGSSVEAYSYDSTVTISVPVRFKPAFDGIKNLYASVENRAGRSSGWQFAGTHSVLTANLPPLISNASTGGGGASTTLYASFTDPNGSGDIRQAWVLVNTSVSAAAACWVFYDRPSNQMGLVNDAGNGEAGRITPGTTAFIENSQCTLSGTGSSVSTYSYNDQLNVAFAVTAKTGFRGLKTVFVNAIDQSGLTTGWQPLTSWNIP